MGGEGETERGSLERERERESGTYLVCLYDRLEEFVYFLYMFSHILLVVLVGDCERERERERD